jgi:hypothetical protein
VGLAITSVALGTAAIMDLRLRSSANERSLAFWCTRRPGRIVTMAIGMRGRELTDELISDFDEGVLEASVKACAAHLSDLRRVHVKPPEMIHTVRTLVRRRRCRGRPRLALRHARKPASRVRWLR